MREVLAVSVSILMLQACGGGSDQQGCLALDAARLSSGLPSCINTSTSAGKALFTTAPDSVSLPNNTPTSYQIGGGTAPYTATSSNIATVTSSVTGTTLTITRITSGAAQILVVDATGKSVAIDTTSTSTALFTTAPSAVNIPLKEPTSYQIGGGTAPYTATSSNTAVVTSTVTGTTLTITRIASGAAQISVSDATGKSVSIGINPSTIDTSFTAPLFTTAPSAITMTSNGSAAYAIGGGIAPYTATSSNTGVLTTSVAGTAVNINSISAGAAQVAVVDAVGKSVTIGVTVLAKGQAGIPPAIFPASITVGNCTTNIPFVFTGGTPPFTVFTGENYRVPVKSPLPFGSDSYFTASVDLLAVVPPSNTPLPPPPLPYTTTLTVLDSQSRTATATVTVPSAFTCPKNTLLQVVSGSQNARITEITTFQIAGGIGPYKVVSTNANIATTPLDSVGAPSDVTAKFDVIAKSTGGDLVGTTLIKVMSSDNQSVNIVFTVYPQP